MNIPLDKAFPIASLPEAEQRIFLQRSVEKAYKKASILFRAEERSEHVWMVKHGRVHLTHWASNGRVLTNCVVTPGEFFCCLSALDRKSYPADAVAAVDSTAVKIPTDLFNRWMQQYPDFAAMIMGSFCARLRIAEHRSSQLQESVRDRILSVLWTMWKKFGGTIPFTCREIAEMAGTTVETTIRTFAQLKKEKLIQLARARITVLDSAKLQRLCGL